PGDLERREGRRLLQNLAGEARQDGLDGGPAGAMVRAGDDLALHVVGGGGLAPARGKAVGLAGIHDPADRLGRLAQGDRKNAGGQRVQRAAMAGLGGVGEMADPGEALRRGQAGRLVDIDPAMHRLAAAASAHSSGVSVFSISARTVGCCSSLDTRSASSKLWSSLNEKVGATRRLICLTASVRI